MKKITNAIGRLALVLEDWTVSTLPTSDYKGLCMSISHLYVVGKGAPANIYLKNGLPESLLFTLLYFLLLINLIRKCQHYSLISLPYLISDIDEKLDKRDLYMVKISDKGAGEEYGIEDIPALVYFENGVPEIFTGKAFPSLCLPLLPFAILFFLIFSLFCSTHGSVVSSSVVSRAFMACLFSVNAAFNLLHSFPCHSLTKIDFHSFRISATLWNKNNQLQRNLVFQ